MTEQTNTIQSDTERKQISDYLLALFLVLMILPFAIIMALLCLIKKQDAE